VNLQALLDWLTGLPQPMLLGAMTILAAVENIFPPIPADVLIAFGAFVAARSDASPLPAFFCVLGGNVLGALGMYAVGRRFGAAWTEEKFHLKHTSKGDARLRRWYNQYGVFALFLGRFVPGARAVVAPFAGALRAPLMRTALAISVASGVWYGIVTIIAFRAGNNWEVVAQTIARLARNTGLVAAAIVLAIAGVWVIRHRARRRRQT
jgi:membrane protein DedA with SNARE-associated domain